MKTKLIGNIFSIFSILFILFLIIITTYEVHVTKYLQDRVDSIKKWDAMHTKYSDFGIHNFIDEGPLYHPSTAAANFIFSLTVIDEDEEQDSEREKYDKGFEK